MIFFRFWFGWWAVCSSVVILTACPAQKPSLSEQKPPLVTLAPPLSPVVEKQKLLLKSFLQADQVHRELLWILMKDRPPLTKTLFGKVARALEQDLGMKLKLKGFFKCDQYAVQKQVFGIDGTTMKFKLFEVCGGMGGSPFAELDWAKAESNKSGQISFFFESEKLMEVIGLGASILNKRMPCQMEWDEHHILKKLKCENMYHDRTGGEVFHIKKLLYQKDKNDLLEASGEVLKNLISQRKFSVSVPLSGKIKFSEVELQPTEEDLAREKEERQKAIEEAKNKAKDVKKVGTPEMPQHSPNLRDFVNSAAPRNETVRPLSLEEGSNQPQLPSPLHGEVPQGTGAPLQPLLQDPSAVQENLPQQQDGEQVEPYQMLTPEQQLGQPILQQSGGAPPPPPPSPAQGSGPNLEAPAEESPSADNPAVPASPSSNR